MQIKHLVVSLVLQVVDRRLGALDLVGESLAPVPEILDDRLGTLDLVVEVVKPLFQSLAHLRSTASPGRSLNFHDRDFV